MTRTPEVISLNKTSFVLAIALFLGGVVCSYADENSAASASAGRRTNITVDTSDLGLISLNDRTDSKRDDERIVFFNQGDTLASVNDDGEPYIGTQF